MHGFLKGIPPDYLRLFSLEEKLPQYLRKKLKQGMHIYDWPAYRQKFGFCDIEPVRNLQAASAYVTKYITKVSAQVFKIWEDIYIMLLRDCNAQKW